MWGGLAVSLLGHDFFRQSMLIGGYSPPHRSPEDKAS
jgi:hypothetical protein